MTLLMITLALLLPAAPATAADEIKKFSLGFDTLKLPNDDTHNPSPSSVTVKYNLGGSSSKELTPYIGMGMAYMLPGQQSSPSPMINAADTATGLKTGIAGQAGFKINVSEQATLNFDYKYLHLPSDIQRGSSNDTRKPQMLGIGLDFKF